MTYFNEKKLNEIASVIDNSTKLTQEFNLHAKGGTEMTGSYEAKPKSHAQRLLDQKQKNKELSEHSSIPGI